MRAAFIMGLVWAQGWTLAPVQGLHEGQVSRVALRGLSIWLGPSQYIAQATILIEQGKVKAIIPDSAFRPEPGQWVLRYPEGTWAYPAFVESWSQWGLLKPKPATGGIPQYESRRHPQFYPREAVRIDFSADTAFIYDAEYAKVLRRMGFAVAQVAPTDGVLRGTGTTILLNDQLPPSERFLSVKPILHASFEKGSAQQEYPSSKMGTIALVRQFLWDALWYKQYQVPPIWNASLERFRQLSRDTLRWCWVAQNPTDAFRIAGIMREFQGNFAFRWAVLGTGYEYEWLPYLPREGLYIQPVGLPALPALHTPDFLAHLPLSALRRWECAPFRARWLLQAGYSVALSSYGLKEPESFWQALRTLARTGISPDSLLLCLTQIPAQWLGAPQIGKIAPGMLANLLLFSDTLWKENAQLMEIWIGGMREVHTAVPSKTPQGIYALSPTLWKWMFPGGLPPYRTQLIVGSDTHNIEVQYAALTQRFSARLPAKVEAGEVVFEVVGDSGLIGYICLPSGERKGWNAVRIAMAPHREVLTPPPPLSPQDLVSRLVLPPQAYGQTKYPAAQTFLFRQAVVWTGDSVLPQTDVLVARGKIQRIGKNLPAPPDAIVIPAEGKALTAGVIDEHSHIAIEGGVNEASEAVTPEVRIRDVIDPTDINIYRLLAGGVTTVQLLHGSANPIGGQSACIKLKWGMPPDSFPIPDAPPFNKFALGENVKQSNWGDAYIIRYPQTRMGVEQIIADAFEAARTYASEWKTYEAQRRKNAHLPAPRRNLRYEALAQILERKRFITCHSYVQSEILMLMRLAERYGFQIRTFTHVLEGYKIAPELKKHGAFASSFSDWWAYKFEVMEAIPHNAAILLSKGVPTCINSDDAEMARRLNQEAAKVLRYGGLELGIDSIQAWRTITVHPAQALGIAHRTGYVKEGYDADLVLWNQPTPLSVYSQPLMTLVEGCKLYDASENAVREQAIRQEKEKLVEKAWKAAQQEQKGLPLLIRRAVLWHCEDRGTNRNDRDE
ncbi:MAG: amidohydrolase family protein [Bacteroidia bacterium]|nr:amidohydrolase family protein [Bacteroidia bacterium]MDW8235520.1 amidohydrolase family protein [Bacteroidia bacterium]